MRHFLGSLLRPNHRSADLRGSRKRDEIGCKSFGDRRACGVFEPEPLTSRVAFKEDRLAPIGRHDEVVRGIMELSTRVEL